MNYRTKLRRLIAKRTTAGMRSYANLTRTRDFHNGSGCETGGRRETRLPTGCRQVVEKFIRPVRIPNGDDSVRILDSENEKGRSETDRRQSKKQSCTTRGKGRNMDREKKCTIFIATR